MLTVNATTKLISYPAALPEHHTAAPKTTKYVLKGLHAGFVPNSSVNRFKHFLFLCKYILIKSTTQAVVIEEYILKGVYL